MSLMNGTQSVKIVRGTRSASAAPLETGTLGLLIGHGDAVTLSYRAFRTTLEQAGVVDMNQSCTEDEELPFHSRVAADDGLRRKFDGTFLKLFQKRRLVKLFVLSFFLLLRCAASLLHASLHDCCW